MFSEFGPITSAVIMRDSEGASKGFGFVCFKEASSAEAAIAKLNGNDGLYVGEAMSKEKRA
jgi:polyadenylate-binding protein